MWYDYVVCNELVACVCVCVPVLCMYIYSKIKRVNKYSSVRDFLKHTDRVVHTVAHSACTKEPVIGKECADLLEDLWSGEEQGKQQY